MRPVEFRDKVEDICARISDLLIDKNEAYGNSALDPVRIFSKASAEEQLLVRIDTKINRLKTQANTKLAKNDIDDLLGYLILYKVLIDE